MTKEKQNSTDRLNSKIGEHSVLLVTETTVIPHTCFFDLILKPQFPVQEKMKIGEHSVDLVTETTGISHTCFSDLLLNHSPRGRNREATCIRRTSSEVAGRAR